MKYVLILTLALFSCKKETKTCNCGIVQSDNVQDYSIVIRNECSNNNKTFFLSEGDWMNSHVGNRQCITDVKSW
jgi:hypothetical protein